MVNSYHEMTIITVTPSSPHPYVSIQTKVLFDNMSDEKEVGS